MQEAQYFPIVKVKYINVVVENKSDQTDNFYTYQAPDDVTVGSKLTVSFARMKKPVDAYCVEVDVTPDFDLSKIKEIVSFEPERSLSPEMIETALWMKKRYGIKYFDAINMFTVAGKKKPKEHEYSDEVVTPEYELTDEQQNAVNIINKSIENGIQESFLIKGVTNSGKTEVYINAVEKALELGKTAIVLLPEIALASQVEKRFIKRFGALKVATLHSKLTTSKKLTEWLRIRSGEAKIVVGARTSIFAPLENIGVIVIDEEHEATYKSDHNPKFDTIDVAFKRAKLNDAALILGSATPSVVSYWRAKQGIYKLIEMNERVADSEMPELKLVDMRAEAKSGNFGVISRELANEIDKTLTNKEQVILFLNRRGFSTQIMCPDCGYHMTCEDCGISLTYHKSNNSAVCHYCGRKYPVPNACPDCGSKFVRLVGTGTEKVEEQVQSIWKDSVVDRFDIDTAKSTAEINKTISDFQNGMTDILVGTQILAKGLDFKNVGLVGVINADIGLSIPDYRSAERTFQLITQVAGRAGRSSSKSKVLIQTYEPSSDVIVQASHNDYETFYEGELLHRTIMNYPPFSDIILVSFVQDAKYNSAIEYANTFRNQLLNMSGMPSEAKILRVREDKNKREGKNRVSFIIKAPQGSRSGYVNAYTKFKEKMVELNADCYIEIDVNPYGIS